MKDICFNYNLSMCTLWHIVSMSHQPHSSQRITYSIKSKVDSPNSNQVATTSFKSDNNRSNYQYDSKQAIVSLPTEPGQARQSQSVLSTRGICMYNMYIEPNKQNKQTKPYLQRNKFKLRGRYQCTRNKL